MKKILSKIKTNWPKVRKYASAHKPLTIISVIVFISLVVVLHTKLSGGSASTQYVLGRVEQGDLAVSVSGSGQVATLGEVSIKPQTVGQAQTLGQIVSVKVQNGDFVKAGQVIVELDGQNALQTLNQAQASVESAQASYDKLIDGPTASDLQSINDSLQSDQTSLANDQENMLLDVQSAYSSVSNSVYINTDPFYQDVTSVNPSLQISGVNFTDQQLENTVTGERVTVGTILNAWRAEINAAASSSTATSTNLTTLLNDSITDLNQIRTYFDNMTSLFSLYGVAESSSAQSTLNGDKSSASGARSGADSSISSITSQLQSYTNAQTNYAQDQQSLAFKVAPPADTDVIVAKSQLDNANANLANAEVNYASRIITAPFDGQIGGLTAQIGQQVSSSDSLGTLITSERVVNVTLNEVDASKVTASDTAQITFDALPGVTIAGHVNYIDPLGTVSQGVVSYSVQIAMDEQNASVLTGMTAIVNINTSDHPNVLMVPNSAITTSGGKSYVLVAEMGSSSAMVNGMMGSSTRARGFATGTFASGTRSMYGNASSSSTLASSSFARSSTTRSFAATSGKTLQVPANTPGLTIVKVPVTIGITNNIDTEILSGLTEGEFIVTRTIAQSTSATTVKTAATQATTRAVGGAAGGAARFGGGGGFGGAGAIGGAGRL